jgi:D-alanyl-D-alanine carboxypeptidase
MSYKKQILILIIAISTFGCKIYNKPSALFTAKFQSELDNQINENIPGLIVSLISKEKKIAWSGASGYDDKLTKTKLLPNQTFRIASVTKSFVAATILRLWEDKKLQLEDPISIYISNDHIEILKKGSYNPDLITIHHLLTHSSGMADHTHSDNYETISLKNNHAWTRTEQLNHLVTYMKPVGELGKQFAYSDTGYILLGEIIEKITQKSLGTAIEEQLNFKKMGLKSTHFEDSKGEFNSNRIHQYYQNEDTYNINPTLDLFGGGGLLATTDDLCRFYQSLFENKVFRFETTLTKMLAPMTYSKKPALDYRIGIYQTEIEGLTAFTHAGFWGTQVVYIPSKKTCIAVNYSQYWNKRGNAPIIPIIVKLLDENL